MRFLVSIIAALTLVPTAVAQAKAPTVNTGGVADVTQSTVTLKGSVNPNGNPTAVYFEIGPTRSYGSQTNEADAGSGTNTKALTGPVGGLSPFTTYHYRLVARYGGTKTVKGKDRTFKSRKQPLGLTLAASPSQVSAGGQSVLSGTLAGTDNAGQQVLLESNPWPYSGFVAAGNPQVVDNTGAFSFPVLGVSVTTQYRVVIPAKADVVSPVVVVGVRQAISTKVTKVRRHVYRFHGTITPGSLATVSVQRHKGSGWKTIESDVSEVHGGKADYSVRVKIRRKGKFRIAAIDTSGAYIPNLGKTVRVRPKK